MRIWMKTTSILALSALAAFTVGCDDARSCTTDGDCFDGEVCAAERCVSASDLERDGGSNDGGQTDQDSGPTEDSGPDEDTGPNEDTGPREDTGPTEDTGPDEDATTGPRIVEVAAGSTQTCALFSDDTLYCWGDNTDGRLSVDLDEDDVLYPDPVVGIDEVTSISADDEHICAIRADASLWCWGINAGHDPGQGWVVLEPYEMPFSNVDRVVAAYDHTCAVIDDGQTVACWGQSDTSTSPSFDAPIVDLAVGSAHACALLDTGDVHCWGNDYYDQLGYGDPVRDLGNVTGIAAGKIHTCARNDAGEVLCWGWNEQGQLGNISEEFQDKTPNPRKVGDIDNAIALTAGTSYSCALLDTGRLLCWGGIKGWPDHHYTQNHDLTEPTTLTGLSSGVEQIEGGARHTCALKTDGSLWCWGENEYGQLGDGQQFDREQPAKVQF